MSVFSAPGAPSDGLLPVRSAGDARGTPIILLHGFLSDGRSWNEVADRLLRASQQPLHLLAFDLPGHGAAAHLRPPEDAWAALAELAAQTYLSLRHEPPIVMGYSLGGRVAAQWLARGSFAAKHLIVESAHPGIRDEAERATRRAVDDQRATELIQVGTAAFVAHWQQLPLFASQMRLSAKILDDQRLLRSSQNAAGLAYSLRAFGTGNTALLPGRSLVMPVTALVGEADGDCMARLPQWKQACNHLTIRVFPQIGHNIHLENPDAWVAAIREVIGR